MSGRPVPISFGMLRCPTCQAELKPTIYEHAHLEECPSCRGHFITSSALHSIAEAELLPRSDTQRAQAAALSGDESEISPDRRTPLGCPECGSAMERLVHALDSGVWIDRCVSHGIWLDRGELERLEAFTEAASRGLVDQQRHARRHGTESSAPREGLTQKAVDVLDAADGVAVAGSVLRALLRPLDWVF